MGPLRWRCSGLGLATVLAAGAGVSVGALAQGGGIVIQGLQENQSLIRQCRQLNQSATVFDNTSLGPATSRLGTLPAGTRVGLTGVVVQGRAQIFLPNNFNGLSPSQPVGWISAGLLSSCGGSPPPSGRACFRANLPLRVRSAPSSSASVIASYNAGDTVYASTAPPTRRASGDGSNWVQVRIFDGSIGWVTETTAYGQIEDISAIACP